MAEEDERDPLIGTVLSGRFEILRRLGSGGMGVVYQARQIGLERIVAIKLVKPEHSKKARVVKRFFREMRATARVESPNTVRLYDVAKTADGQLYLAMEYLEGVSLMDRCRQGRLEIDSALYLAAQIARGLSAAHKEGIIHRDLKPANIMLLRSRSGRYRAKILDFGVAHFLDPSDKFEREPLTISGMVMGTPEFMAPEQVLPGPVDARCDLYALGAVLFLLLTGRPPFVSPSAVGLMNAHVNEIPIPPSQLNPEIPDWVDNIVLKLLAKDPERRYSTADELIHVLEQAAGEIVEYTDVPAVERQIHPDWSPEPPIGTSLSRKRSLLGLFAVVVGVSTIVGAALGVFVVLALGH